MTCKNWRSTRFRFETFNFNVSDLFFRTLISALHVWLDSYPEDFKDPPNFSALKELLDFCEEYLPSTELDAKVRHRLERYDINTHYSVFCMLINGLANGTTSN